MFTPIFLISFSEVVTRTIYISMTIMSPVILLVIVIVAVIIFIFGILQLLIRYFIKAPSFSSLSQSNRYPDYNSGSHTFQRQLQQLFRLHDSGLDQALIDALPVFYYKEIMGLKEPFDCAVCLCEFSNGDKLKLLPNCSHAFHIHCIETWLLSNSTCPLCRNMISHIRNPFSHFDEQRGLYCSEGANDSFSSRGAGIFSVQLGKFRKLSEGLASVEKYENEVSSSSLDARRCYSMGAFRYVVGDSELQVALSSNGKHNDQEQLCNNAELDGNKINCRSTGDSFSVSKIWLWSKKGKFRGSSEDNGSIVLPISSRNDFV